MSGADGDWLDVGAAAEVPDGAVREFPLGRQRIAVIRRGESWGAISGVCNHVGGPLGQGRLDGEYVVCPWHGWKFHHRTGEGEPGFEEDRVPTYAVRVDGGRVFVGASELTKRNRKPHAPHPLTQLRSRGSPNGPGPDA